MSSSYKDMSDNRLLGASQATPVVKNPSANTGDARRCRFSLWLGKILWRENDNPLQYSCPESSMGRWAWQATVHGLAKSWTQLSTHASITMCLLETWIEAYQIMAHFNLIALLKSLPTDTVTFCICDKGEDFSILILRRHNSAHKIDI